MNNTKHVNPGVEASVAQPYVHTEENAPMEKSFFVWIILSFLAMGLIVFTAFFLCKRMKKKEISRGDSEDGFIPWSKAKPILDCKGGKPPVMISHSLPDLSRSVSQEQLLPQENNNCKKVSRQTTLPTVPQRHASFRRQLSHKLNIDGVEFSVCSLQRRNQLGNIRPELYHAELAKQDSVESNLSSEVDSAGKLSFSLNYDAEMEGLIIKVIQAQDLPVKDVTGSSDPYIKIYLLPDRAKKFCTKVHRRNLSPVFNETFFYSVPWNELAERTLQFSVYDFDRFSRNDLIGQVLVRRLQDHIQPGVELEYVHDIVTNKQDTKEIGELMLSLCYLPKAGRLTVTVIKMRNLKALDITGSSDPYVKVSLLCQGKRIKKKKTSVKRATLNPVYNESLVFDVPNENIQDTTLLVKVLDYDRVGSNELMGVVVIGNQAMGQGRDHWIEMLESSRYPIAQWYTLMDSVPNTIPVTPINVSAPLSCLSST
ncbi:UNVERIFIED_CONTAM: hypothetical protein RMT77_003825 [Armadillidium vulgare]